MNENDNDKAWDLHHLFKEVDSDLRALDRAIDRATTKAHRRPRQKTETFNEEDVENALKLYFDLPEGSVFEIVLDRVTVGYGAAERQEACFGGVKVTYTE